jgi:hypothetical protein
LKFYIGFTEKNRVKQGNLKILLRDLAQEFNEVDEKIPLLPFRTWLFGLEIEQLACMAGRRFLF